MGFFSGGGFGGLIGGVVGGLIGGPLGSSIGSAIGNVSDQRKANKLAERASELQAKRASAENARQRRRSILESRRARAQAIALAENTGLAGGSQQQGAAGSILSQGATNVSFLQSLDALDQARYDTVNKYNRLRGNMELSQALTGQASNFTSFFNAART